MLVIANASGRLEVGRGAGLRVVKVGFGVGDIMGPLPVTPYPPLS